MKNKIITSKTIKTSLILTSITIAMVAIVGTVSILMIQPTLGKPNNISNMEFEPTNVSLPNQYVYRAGVQMLMTTDIAYNENLPYHVVSEDQYGWLDRSIKNGVTLVSVKELDQYFTLFGTGHNNFQINSKDGSTKYIRIDYSEPPIDVNKNYVYAYILDEVNPTHKVLPNIEKSQLGSSLDKPYRWTSIDESSAIMLNALLTSDGSTFKTMTPKGEVSFKLMYVGSKSPELSLPEIASMYALSSVDGGQ